MTKTSPGVIKEARTHREGRKLEPVEPPRKCGSTAVEETQPTYRPHRIRAACDFEVQTPDYDWYAGSRRPETSQIVQRHHAGSGREALPECFL